MCTNFTENVKNSIKIYENYGPAVLFEEIWRHIIRHSKFIEAIVGPELHEKIAVYPQLRYWPNIKNPKTFNEKILNRKLHTDNDLYTAISDKYTAREFVAEKGFSEILNELYLITSDPDDILIEELPDKFVMKGTHGGGSSYIKLINQEDEKSRSELRKAAESWLSQTFGDIENEYWYEDIKPRIMIEEFVEPETGKAPIDYKFFVFSGRGEFIEVDQGRFDQHHRVMYNRDWEMQSFKYGFPIGKNEKEPSNLQEMINISESLGAEFEFVRVDLYNPRPGEVRFGEMTLAPESGEKRFEPEKYDFKLGQMW